MENTFRRNLIFRLGNIVTSLGLIAAMTAMARGFSVELGKIRKGERKHAAVNKGETENKVVKMALKKRRRRLERETLRKIRMPRY